MLVLGLAPIAAKSLLKAKPIFFLVCQSDQRKLLANLRKKGFAEKACSEERDWLLKTKNGKSFGLTVF